MAKRITSNSTTNRLRRKRNSFLSKKISPSLIIAFLILLMFGIGYYYRNALAYYFSFKSDKMEAEAVRHYQIMSKYENNVIGIDVSEYQGKVDWALADTIQDVFAIGFVFVRATYGRDRQDLEFTRNWGEIGKLNVFRGAYHYYRPDENSLEQAQNFINQVVLKKGDLPPVLDIERIPEGQSIDSLKTGLRRWLKKVENHYKVKPIIYCGESYYYDFLADEFKDYTVWIANYNFFVEEIEPGWQFWQFTQTGKVPGIVGNVDIDVFNGTVEDLKRVAIKK